MNEIDERSEWLEADGIGGFASGTVSGVRTRRYHALLLAATTPPTGRMVLVNGLDAWVTTPSGRWALSTQRYPPWRRRYSRPVERLADEPLLAMVAAAIGGQRGS